MDSIDRAIVGALVTDGRRTVQDIAAIVQLSASATRQRVRRLERSGLIVGYTARLDPGAAGFAVEAMIDVDTAPGADPAAFEAGLRDMPAVVEALHATGEHDYIVRVRCCDTAELHQVTRHLKGDIGAAHTSTRLILDETIPQRPRLP